VTRLVALSASYGALGSVIGPAVAERLGVPFLDRAIPLAVSRELDLPVEQADADRERTSGSFLERLLASFASAEPITGAMPLNPTATTPDDFHRVTEEVLLRHARDGSGVLLGRGGAYVLRDDPRVLRVRLDGDPEARERQAMQLMGIDRETAQRARRNTDRAHADYGRRFYGSDPRDPILYHLMIDATALPSETCVELIVTAAHAL
jgi:cytidylate kinase